MTSNVLFVAIILILEPALNRTVHDTHINDDTFIAIIMGVEDQCFQAVVRISLRVQALSHKFARIISLIPIPAFAEASTASLASSPITSSISCFTFSGSALGRSILLITGKISKIIFQCQVYVSQAFALQSLVQRLQQAARLHKQQGFGIPHK